MNIYISICLLSDLYTIKILDINFIFYKHICTSLNAYVWVWGDTYLQIEKSALLLFCALRYTKYCVGYPSAHKNLRNFLILHSLRQISSYTPVLLQMEGECCEENRFPQSSG